MVEEDAFLVDDFEVVYVLTTPMSELMEDDTVEAIRLMQLHGGLILVPRLMFLKIVVGLRHESIEDRSVLYMGDDHFAHVHGKGSVVLEFSSGKSITLFNVLYVLKLRLGYYNNGMFMLNLNKVPDNFGSVYMSSSTVVNSSLWHACLRHVHYKRMLEMSKDDLIPAIDENLEKCLSEGFWGEAMLTACYLLNMVPNKRNKTTPYEPWFYVIEPNDSVSINLIIESRIAIFDENHFSSIPRPKDIIPNFDESQRDDHSNDVPSETLEPRGEAIDDEIGSIMENNTWVLFDLPPYCKPLGCKWIFKRKMKFDGTIDKFKARLVIQGFRQKEGIDFFDTYAPVALITTIRLLLDLSAIQNLVIHQMDVKTTFLNGDLDKEVKFESSGKGVVICLYVDDMLILGTNQNQVDKTKKILSSRFSMKSMGEADGILDNKIKLSTPMDPLEKLKLNTGDVPFHGLSTSKTCITGSTMESEFVALAAFEKIVSDTQQKTLYNSSKFLICDLVRRTQIVTLLVLSRQRFRATQAYIRFCGVGGGPLEMVKRWIGKWSKQETNGPPRFLPEDRHRKICEKHYNQKLSIMAEKVHQEKLQGVQTRLTYGESSWQKAETKKRLGFPSQSRATEKEEPRKGMQVKRDVPAQEGQPKIQTIEGKRQDTMFGVMLHAPAKEKERSKENGTRLIEQTAGNPHELGKLTSLKASINEADIRSLTRKNKNPLMRRTYPSLGYAKKLIHLPFGSKAFLRNFLQQKKYINDPVKIHHIKQKEGDSIEAFMERFKAESMHVNKAPECMMVYGFMHGITNPDLIKRLNDNIPKSINEMMSMTIAFLRGEVAVAN
uniref:Zinc finger, CCHC-type n=1 Tax=Tanacetum cinerariifolium TaxID=118510 RepID=A0A6L2JFM4_TANCI|nr:zinc finger, CCHC-type [Tanacetum cinerariifolium]